jgi:hypothetical protein
LKHAITYRRKVGRERENKVYSCIFILYWGRYCRFCTTDKRQNVKGEVVGAEKLMKIWLILFISELKKTNNNCIDEVYSTTCIWF